MPTDNLALNSPWQLTPELQAALDAANAKLAEQAQKRPALGQDSLAPQMARELVAWGRIKLKPAGAALLEDGMSSQAFFEALLAHGCLADARRVLAHALPRRRALWWSVIVAKHAFGERMSGALAQAVRVVTQYVVDPSEDTRRAAGELLRKMPPNTVAKCLAAAMFFSAGSISPTGLPPVAPKPFITGRLVGVSVYLASVAIDPACYKQYLREYLAWGRAIAAGQMLWEEAIEPASRLTPYWSRLAAGPTARANELEPLPPLELQLMETT